MRAYFLLFCVCFVSRSPGPSEPAPAESSASSVSHNAAAPYGNTNTEWLEDFRRACFK